MTEARQPDLSTVAITAGRGANGTALAAPLWPSSVWVTPTLDDARQMATGTRAEQFYSRFANPTVSAFESAVAELEGAESALAFASGMGAVATVVLALCSAGDHIVATQQIYSGTKLFLANVGTRFGFEVTYVDGTKPGAFAEAVRPGRTMLVMAETPANPRLDLNDLDELGSLRGPFTVVDSTFATPVLQQPHRHGVDLVLHSATKGIAGHNDATLGVITGARDLVDSIWAYSVLHGACASPFDALNGLRGIRTLPVRVERQCATALTLARYLEAHPAVASVRYPGLESHPQHELAVRQMRGFGTMVTFDLRAGRTAAGRFAEGVEVAKMATSLGGPETLVTAPAASTHAGLTPDERAAVGISEGLVRMSVGLEHPSDLIADLDQALAKAQAAVPVG